MNQLRQWWHRFTHSRAVTLLVTWYAWCTASRGGQLLNAALKGFLYTGLMIGVLLLWAMLVNDVIRIWHPHHVDYVRHIFHPYRALYLCCLGAVIGSYAHAAQATIDKRDEQRKAAEREARQKKLDELDGTKRS